MAAKKKKVPFVLTDIQMARFEQCYKVYRKKNKRGVDEQTWASYDFDQETTDMMERAIIAQNRADNGQTHRKYIPALSVWLNASGWRNEIASSMSQEKPDVSRGTTCTHCRNGVKEKGDMCQSCTDIFVTPVDKQARQYVKDKGIVIEGDTQRQGFEKCRENALSQIKKMDPSLYSKLRSK